jgi:serine O-acetyltransferase
MPLPPNLYDLEGLAVRLHRLAHRLELNGRSGLANVVSATNRLVTGVEIEPGATIGAGLVIRHGLGIVINKEVRIGRDCQLFQQVTLGLALAGHSGAPVLGDRVRVGTGAKVLGPVVIGDDAWIGANAVVLHDVPAGTRAVGVPARVIAPRTSPEDDESLASATDEAMSGP